jgi:hypothetical protein
MGVGQSNKSGDRLALAYIPWRSLSSFRRRRISRVPRRAARRGATAGRGRTARPHAEPPGAGAGRCEGPCQHAPTRRYPDAARDACGQATARDEAARRARASGSRGCGEATAQDRASPDLGASRWERDEERSVWIRFREG